MYQLEVKKGGRKTLNPNIDDFFRFTAETMRDVEAESKKQIEKTVKTKTYDTKTLIHRDAVRGMNQLIVESFAVSIILKENTDVANYLIWFMEWTEKLLDKWSPDLRHVDAKAPQPSIHEKLKKALSEEQPS